MHNHGTEDRHATLIAGLILVILLAAVAVFASPAAGRRSQEHDFAAAVPDTSVFFVEISNPVEQIGLIAEMGLLPDLADLVAVVGSRSGSQLLVRIGTILESWPSDPDLRADLESVAGYRAAFVLLRNEPSPWPTPLIAIRGPSGSDPADALAPLISRLGLGTVVITGSSSATQSFAIEDATGHPIMNGRVAGDWLVMGPPDAVSIISELAGCLAGWESCPEYPLAALPAFDHAAEMLPEDAPIRGFLNLPQVGAVFEDSGEPAACALFGWTEGIAFAREITEDGLETWAAGRLVAATPDDRTEKLLAGLAPIDEALSTHFPDNALATYDLGAPAAETVEVLAHHIETCTPLLHRILRTVLDDFRMASGLNPELDLLPFLGRDIAVGVLPPEGDPDGWPLPRPILIVRSTDDEAVRRFSEAWLRWEAGALAPVAQGLLSAALDSRQIAGVEVLSLQVDSVLATPIPLPSPTVVVTDGLVIVSPVRSAAVEILSGHGSKETPQTASVNRTAAVEKIWLNFPAWPEAWRRAEGLFESPSLEPYMELEPVIDVVQSLMRLLGGFGPANGTTTVASEGDFVFHAVVDYQ